MKRLIYFFLLAGLLFPRIAGAQNIIATGSGRARIVNGDEPGARDEALYAALDDALGKAVGQLMGADPASWSPQQTDLVEAKIFANRSKYLVSNQTLKESSDGGYYLIKVRAEIRREELHEDLRNLHLIKRAHTWHRIMVVIPEQHITRFIPDPAAETEIIKTFLEARYRVVDQNQIRAIRYNEQVRAACRGDVEAAEAIGRKYGAELIIVGEAFSELASANGGLVGCRARVEAKLLRTDTGEILAAQGDQASDWDGLEDIAAKKALAKAGKQVADYFLDQLDRRDAEATEEGTPATITLVISDIPYDRYNKLKDAMQQGIPGIAEFHELNYEAKRAELEVEFRGGDGQKLAGTLATHQFSGFRLKIVSTTPNRIEMVAGPAGRSGKRK